MTRGLALAALIIASCSNTRSNMAPIVAETPIDAAPAAPKPVSSPLTIKSAVRVPRIRPAPDPALEPLLGALRKANSVGGAAVGYAGQESRFHGAGRELLPKADRKLLLWLADDDHPALRALGFAGLGALGDTETLVRHVCDREWVEVCPGGCVCHDQSIGSIAQQYLWSPGWLGVGVSDAGSNTLLSGPERVALAMRLGAIDACSLGAGAREELRHLGASGWSWEVLRAATLDVPAWVVVKAVARLESERSRSMLITVLDDASMQARARLAAASGLTLSTSVDAEAALLRHAAFLDGQRKGLDSELAGAVRLRRKADALLWTIDKSTAWTENEKHASDAVAAYALRHPFILDRVKTGSFGARDPDVKRARANALLWVSEHLAEHSDCWSVYRDAAYGLERMLDHEQRLTDDGLPRQHRPLGELTESELARFAANVRAATVRLDRDKTCTE